MNRLNIRISFNLALLVATAVSMSVKPASAQGVWITLAPMPTARKNLVTVTGNNGLIYAIGGRLQDGSAAFRRTEVYNPTLNAWTSGVGPNDGHYGGAGVLGKNGNIYLMGGYYQDPTLETFNISSGTWSTLAPMQQGRFGFAAVTGADGRIYTFGGDISGGGGNVNTSEVYNPLTNVWSTIAPTPNPIINPGAALGKDGKIYLIGGLNNVAGNAIYSSQVLVYDPVLNTWGNGGPMYMPRNAASVVAGNDGLIYVEGGEQGVGALGRSLDLFDAYDPVSQSWQILPSLPAVRELTGATVGLDGTIYAFGGTDLITQGFSTVFAYKPMNTSTVPEPGAFALLAGVGVSGGLLYLRRRKRR